MTLSTSVQVSLHCHSLTKAFLDLDTNRTGKVERFVSMHACIHAYTSTCMIARLHKRAHASPHVQTHSKRCKRARVCTRAKYDCDIVKVCAWCEMIKI